MASSSESSALEFRVGLFVLILGIMLYSTSDTISDALKDSINTARLVWSHGIGKV